MNITSNSEKPLNQDLQRTAARQKYSIAAHKAGWAIEILEHAETHLYQCDYIVNADHDNVARLSNVAAQISKTYDLLNALTEECYINGAEYAAGELDTAFQSIHEYQIHVNHVEAGHAKAEEWPEHAILAHVGNCVSRALRMLRSIWESQKTYLPIDG
jgi:hypothetical protein